MKKLCIVADDAGYPQVDVGIIEFVKRTGVPICADYMNLRNGGVELAKQMKRSSENNNRLKIGLHFELEEISDQQRYDYAISLAAQGKTLGQITLIQDRAKADSIDQLKLFTDNLEQAPAHISTHGDFNLGPDGKVMQWWIDHMLELFKGDFPPMQHQNGAPVVRHNKYSWNLDELKQDPSTPEEFKDLLLQQQSDAVELVLHPAKKNSRREKNMIPHLFTAEMREVDLASAIEIINSGEIENAGFQIVPVSELATAAV